MPVIDALNWPLFILWTIFSIILGGLLDRFADDLYRYVIESYNVSRNDWELRESELKELMNNTSYELRGLSRKAGSIFTMFGNPDDPTKERYHEVNNIYNDEIKPEVDKIISELSARKVDTDDIERSEQNLKIFVDKIHNWEHRLDDRGVSLQEFLEPDIRYPDLYADSLDPVTSQKVEFMRDINKIREHSIGLAESIEEYRQKLNE
jgi:hypothetical protein